MEPIEKRTLLDAIGRVFEESKDCRLEPSCFDKMEEDLTLLSGYFLRSKTQSFFLALVFVIYYRDESVDNNDLIIHLDCNPMRLLEFGDDFESLFGCGILVKKKSRVGPFGSSRDQYAINGKVTEAILKNMPIPDVADKGCDDVIDLLERLFNLGEQRDDGVITTRELFAKTKDLLSRHESFRLIQRLSGFNLQIEDSYFFLYLVWKTLVGRPGIDLETATSGIFDNLSQRLRFVQEMVSGNNNLFQLKLVELVEAEFFNDTQIKLSDTALAMLEEFDIRLQTVKSKAKNIIDPDSIHPKELFFGEEENKQLDLLKSLLIDTNFKQTQQRLLQKGLPGGIVVLLHGSPGTGKTEMVYQIAKESNREIMKVDISQSKSMWFGESEKIIKKIFTDYTTYAKKCVITPILLFNEADAIISKRREMGSSGVAQTENAIQNIILEELEKFEGIFMATTNLIYNLDAAFERRFLFKIEFRKPDNRIKAQIWKSKLPGLSLPDCESLASRFDLSGGQINNIVRKNEIYEIIHGGSVSFGQLVEFCEKEFLTKTQRVMIGFNNHHDTV